MHAEPLHSKPQENVIRKEKQQLEEKSNNIMEF